jgi:hypothetical protein
MRELKEIVLPISGHKIFLAKSIKYGEQLELNSLIFNDMEIENQVKGKKVEGQTQKMSGSGFVSLLKRKIAIYVKKIVLAFDVEGIGKAEQEINEAELKTINMEVFICDLEKEDGEYISSEIDKIESSQKKSS